MPPEQLVDKGINGTPEERVDKTIAQIKKKCQEMAVTSNCYAEALSHTVTLIELSTKGLFGVGILNAIIERRRSDSRDYNAASREFEGRILTCLGNDEKDIQLHTLALLNDGLHRVKEEISLKPF